MDTYLDALQYFPDDADVIEVAKGRAFLVKKDIFRNLMWYSMADSTKHYPLSIETVKKIKEQNNQGIKPAALETVEIISEKPKEVEPEFVDVVGQLSLKSLEKNSRKRRSADRKNVTNKNRPKNRQPQKKQEKTPQNSGKQQRPNSNKNNGRRNPPQK